MKAFSAGADAVVVDLEDAVPAIEKREARDVVINVAARLPKSGLRLIRVNSSQTPFFDDDVAVAARAAADAIVLPKADPTAVAALANNGPPVVAIVETANGLRLAYETAAHPRVTALLLGSVDLALELGLEQLAGAEELLYARSKLVTDSAAAGIRPPIDRVWTAVRDGDGFEADTRRARALGFRAKACIHPAQVAVVNRVFTPTDAELERARGLVAAFDGAVANGRGAVLFNGEMIDLPVAERARQLLEQAARRAAG
jgi:citrate lyase beta subunit